MLRHAVRGDASPGDSSSAQERGDPGCMVMPCMGIGLSGRDSNIAASSDARWLGVPLMRNWWVATAYPSIPADAVVCGVGSDRATPEVPSKSVPCRLLRLHSCRSVPVVDLVRLDLVKLDLVWPDLVVLDLVDLLVPEYEG